MNSDKPVYNVQMRARAGTAATFRAAVAAYIFYLGWTVLRGTLTGSSSVPAWAAWLAGLVFMGGAIGFGVYTWRRYQADLKAAIVPDASKPEEDT